LSEDPAELERSRENSPKRIYLPSDLNLEEDKDQILNLWKDQEKYVDFLESKLNPSDSKDEKKPDNASRREHLLICRLSIKEQELQELSNQIAELKAAQSPAMSALRNSLLDPAVNIVIQNLKKELETTKKKMQETQDELSAWKFTPDSVTGKRLMAKCRQLLQENEDLGKMISSGRLAKLEGELAMQKNMCEEMKKGQMEMDDFVQELDEDVEGMQSTIFFLQQQLKEAKETITNLETKLAANKNTTDQEDETTTDNNEDEPVAKRAKKNTKSEEVEAGMPF